MVVREARIEWVKRGEVEGKVQGPIQAAMAMRKVVGDDPREHFCALYLDTRQGLIDVEVLSIGTLNQSLVHPREVFRTAILRSAESIVIAHQHPSGDANPSREDMVVTERLVKAGRIIGIEVVDHVVVGDAGRFVSIRSLRPEIFGA